MGKTGIRGLKLALRFFAFFLMKTKRQRATEAAARAQMTKEVEEKATKDLAAERAKVAAEAVELEIKG